MSNILLVDTNFSSGPIYNFLIQSGHSVTVIGGNPKDALAKSIENYVQLDYSDIVKTDELIKNRNIEYIIPGCNDRSYMVCAEINKDGRFPGIDSLQTSETINNKEKFRTFTRRHNIPHPKQLSSKEIGTRWPVIVKPVDAFSGKGISIIRDMDEKVYKRAVIHACEASHNSTCIVEDYVEGQLHSHSAFIQNGKILVDFIVEEHCIANPFVVDTSRLVYDFPEEMLNNIRKDIELIARELTLKDGLIHTQFICKRDQYWLIEMTRRCPGDLYSQLIELSTGMKYAENYARPFIGAAFNIAPHFKKNWIMRHTITQTGTFTLGSVDFTRSINLSKWIPISKTGDILRGSPLGRIAVMFAKEKNEQEMDQLFQLTLKRELYVVNP